MWQNDHWNQVSWLRMPNSGCSLYKVPDKPLRHLCLPTSCWPAHFLLSFLRSKAGSRNTFCSDHLLWKTRREGLVAVKHDGGEAFLCYFPVSIQTQHEAIQTRFIVFLQDDTFSLFTLTLSPTVGDISVENSISNSPLRCCSFPSQMETCISDGSINNI